MMVDFPSAPLAATFEIYYDGTWNDITAYTRMQDGPVAAVITHGRADEASRPDPAKCTFMIDNTDGRFSPRNPRSPLYGKIGRNTRFRLRITYDSATYDRFHGEISRWPVAWEPSEADVWVSIEASGITRRLGQQSSPVVSPIRRTQMAQAGLVAYWPLEDPDTATELGSAVPNGLPMQRRSGTTSLASNGDIAGAADLPSFESGWWQGQVQPYTAGNVTQMTWVQSVSSPPATIAWVAVWNTTGTAHAWGIALGSDGFMEFRAYGAGGRVLTVNLNTPDDQQEGHQFRWSVVLTQNGANIDYEVYRTCIDTDLGTVGSTGTLNGFTVGRVKELFLNDPNSPLGSVAIGHMAIATQEFSILGMVAWSDQAFVGEYAEARVARVLEENGIPYDEWFATTGSDATRMGPQPVASVLEVLNEIADLGVLIFDNRADFGLRVLPMAWRQDMNLAIEVSYGQLTPPFLPVEDDQNLVNDVTVSQKGGSSARHQVSDGPLSVQDPPDGVGIYDASTTLSLETPEQAAYWAQWLAAFGSWDEARYPVVHFDLTSDVAGDLIPFLIADLNGNDNTGTEVGQVIRVTDPPDFLPGGPIELMINGWTEKVGPWTWELDFTCSPAGPWRSWILEERFDGNTDRSHVDTAGSVTASSFVAGTGTSLSVTTTSGPRWVTPADQAAAFPFDIVVSGVVLRVTSISGTGSTQTFTVEQDPVNAVTKTIPAGSAVNIVPVMVGV